MAHEAEAAREPLAGFRGEVLATWAEWTRLQLRLGSPFAHKVRELLVLRTRLRRPRRRLRHNCCDTPQRQDENAKPSCMLYHMRPPYLEYLPASVCNQNFSTSYSTHSRMTRGQDGSLCLSCVTLTFTTPRRFIPCS